MAALSVPPLLDAEQVAAILGRSPRTVLKAARRGELPVCRLGHRTLRFRPEDVAAYIADRTEGVRDAD